ncbi:MAG: PAS domain-containing protein [Ferruginibacter sp.]
MNTTLPTLQLIAMNNARDCIIISDARQPDMPLIFVNKAFCALTGYEPGEVLGKNSRFLQRKDRASDKGKDVQGPAKGSQTVYEEIISYKKDGTPFWNRRCVMPVFNENNELTHYISIQEDVTMQKHQEASARKKANLDLITKTTRLTEEKERKELGEELHDNVNQLLAVTKLYLNIAMEQEDKTQDMIKQGKEMLMNAMEEIRKLSKKLTNPEAILSLESAIATLKDSVQVGVAFPVIVEFDKAAEARLTNNRKIAFYRIIQEQLNNIIKYANPTEVVIRITAGPEAVQLSVKDNGVGFDSACKPGGIGLTNMRNRAENEKGMFIVKTAEAQGCEILVTFPCNLTLLKAVTQSGDPNLAVHPVTPGVHFNSIIQVQSPIQAADFGTKTVKRIVRSYLS